MNYKNIVFPNYDHCILGTISSILKYYNVETKHKTSEKIDAILNEREYRNVIFRSQFRIKLLTMLYF